VQNADLILSIGARLDTKATGSPGSSFARGARKIVVDIDGSELGKFGRCGVKVDLPIAADAAEFLRALDHSAKRPLDVTPWLQRISAWKERYPVCRDEYFQEQEINPYAFVTTLANHCPEGETIVLDTGCTLAWMMQAFHFKRGQRVYHDWNNTAMGWALPASIGASLAQDGCPVLCVTGDGSLQMNIQELATIVRHRLPIRIFLLNNHGHSMIQQTQDQWLGSRYLASSVEGGLADPDYVAIARAYGLPTVNLHSTADLDQCIRTVLESTGPVFCNVEVPSRHRVNPQVKFGRPNEDPEPFLSRPDFLDNMIVSPLEVSRQPLPPGTPLAPAA
jgi:acetolactate synthase-1/2/3 large subunit